MVAHVILMSALVPIGPSGLGLGGLWTSACQYSSLSLLSHLSSLLWMLGRVLCCGAPIIL